jgi:hypothetical protein
MNSFKQQVIEQYVAYFHERINAIRSMIATLTEDAQNDAKGSAGDKHETGLAMMHLEQEKLNQKLLELLESRKKFSQIDYGASSSQVVLGSLIHTPTVSFLVSVALPKIDVDGKTVIGISPQSPLGSLFLQQQVGAQVAFNGFRYMITSVE